MSKVFQRSFVYPDCIKYYTEDGQFAFTAGGLSLSSLLETALEKEGYTFVTFVETKYHSY